MTAPPFHSSKQLSKTWLNRTFLVIYSAAVSVLLLRHIRNLIYSSLTFISFTLLVADFVLAFLWLTAQSFHWNPIERQVYPENLKQVIPESEYPGLDVVICTADPTKEPPVGVVNTALSVLAYDYPTDKLSVYISDDGGSDMTLYAFIECAKFAKYWIPYCKKHNIVDRAPEAYFGSDHHAYFPETDEIKEMYESIRSRVETVVQNGRVCLDQVMESEFHDAFGQWTPNFTRRRHPTVIQTLLDDSVDKDIRGRAMPNLIYVSREKKLDKPHNFKAGALNAMIGFRYGTLTEDTYTSFRLHCEGWKSVICNPSRDAFLGGSPSNLNDALTQIKRWYMGFLEIFFKKYCPLTYGTRSMNPLQALCYTHYTLRSFWSIPVIIYAFLPQISLINSFPLFTKVTGDGYMLYAFLFLGAYCKDFLDFVVFGGGSIQRWWSVQRMWLLWGLSSYPFALLEWSLKSLGLSTFGFNVTSKVVDEDQSKRYEQGVFEFGVDSVLFFPISVASMINLISFVKGVIGVLMNGRLEDFFVQIFVASFAVLNSWPIYEGMFFRRDRGMMPLKVTLASMVTTIVICVASFLVF